MSTFRHRTRVLLPVAVFDVRYLLSLERAKHPPIASSSHHRGGTQTFAFGSRDTLPRYASATLVLRDTSGRWRNEICLEDGFAVTRAELPQRTTAVAMVVYRAQPQSLLKINEVRFFPVNECRIPEVGTLVRHRLSDCGMYGDRRGDLLLGVVTIVACAAIFGSYYVW
jgi:hypothetical protein